MIKYNKYILIILPLIFSYFFITPIWAVNKEAKHASESKKQSKAPSIIQAKNQLIYGIGFSPFIKDQSPWKSSDLTERQVENKIHQVAPYVKAVRTFASSPEYMKNVDKIAKKHKLKIIAGAWFNKQEEVKDKKTNIADISDNEKEFQAILKMAKRGNLDAVVLGSETLFRNDLNEDQLITYIKRFKSQFPKIPVTTADTHDVLANHPNVVDNCDFIFANIYPYWEKVPIDKAMDSFKTVVGNLHTKYPKKQIIISETGWPSSGGNEGPAVASPENAKKYFEEIRKWAAETGTKVFYFSAFDEAWKSTMEGGVGGHWGIINEDGKLKFEKEKLKTEEKKLKTEEASQQ